MKPSRCILLYTINSIFLDEHMFLTYEHAKIDEFGLFGRDPNSWTYVEHNIHRPWFYVAAREPGDDFCRHPMLMLSNEQLLQSLVSDQGKGLLVESVMVVTPDHINRSGHWLMEPLKSIVRLKASRSVAYVYQVAGDRTYTYGDSEITVREGVESQVLFDSSLLFSIADPISDTAAC